MDHALKLERTPSDAPVRPRQLAGTSSIGTAEVYVIFTSAYETLAAGRAAPPLTRTLGVPLTLVDFRSTPAARGAAPDPARELAGYLRSEGVDVRVREFVTGRTRHAIPLAFARHSVIVIGGRRRWWPTRAERWRRALEAAGHFVVVVEEATQAG